LKLTHSLAPPSPLYPLHPWQLAFIGHDVGHRCVFEHRRRDGILGCLVTAFLGIGVSHWVDNHNAHHAVVNSSDCDPEVRVRVRAFTN
jgi:fatty acid desaturase